VAARTLDYPATLYRVRPHGPNELEVVTVDVQGATVVGEPGAATLAITVAAKNSAPPGLTFVRVGIAVPRAEILDQDVEPAPAGFAEVVHDREVVWRIARLVPGPSGPTHVFTVTFKPQLAGTLRLSFTVQAAELGDLQEIVWDHEVQSASSP
jgi:hypothetical protein